MRVAKERNTAEQGRGDERDGEIRSLRQQHTQQVQGLQQIIQSQVNCLEEKDHALRANYETIAAGQHQLREQRDKISRLERDVEEKERQERYQIQQQEREKNVLMVEKERLKREKNRVIEGKDRQLGRVNQQLEECEQVIAQFQRRIAELEQLRPATDATPRSKQQSRSRIKMTWMEGRKAPCMMSSSYNAVADDSAAVYDTALYVRLENYEVYAFTTSTSSWSQLPDSPTSNCPSVIVNNLLTLVGGKRGLTTTNQLFSLTGEGSGRRWTEEFPPMPTKRYGSTALCTGTALIVAGGVSEYYSSPQIVEVMNTTVYVRLEYNKVYAFTPSTSSWSQLPDSPNYECPFVIVNNRLTLVGGKHGVTTMLIINQLSLTTNQLFSLTGEGSDRRWTEEFPPMPTKRRCSTAVCTGTDLIVAGGESESVDRSTLQTVEVMNTETLRWSTAADLPQPVVCVPGAICGDRVYILSLESHFKSIYTCPVSAIILSCWSRPTADVWNKIAAPPVTNTTCVSILGRLLTIGGVDTNIIPTTAVYMYNPDFDSWEVISHMATPRRSCFAAVLPNNQLIVVGGYTAILFDFETDSVELATVE